MNWPYKMYVIKGVNPQYGISLKQWMLDIGMLEPIIEKLISNLQKFRIQSIQTTTAKKVGNFGEN